MALMRKFPRFREAWGRCGTCGFSVPVSRLRYSAKYGWQCLASPGAVCVDPRPDRDDRLAARRFPLGEGARRTQAPRVDPLEGAGIETGHELGYGQTPYGQHSYGDGSESDTET